MQTDAPHNIHTHTISKVTMRATEMKKQNKRINIDNYIEMLAWIWEHMYIHGTMIKV